MKKHHWYIIGFGTLTVGLGFLAYHQRNKLKNTFNEIFDYRTEKQLLTMDPSFRKKMKAFLSAAKKEGIDLRIVEGHRSCARQNKLYAQGRTAPGKKVTNAKCGFSIHNYNFIKGVGAADVYEFKNGKILFENPNWNRIGQLAVQQGLEWGGNWKKFKDRPHVQNLQAHSVRQLYAQHKDKFKPTT